jgi:hypothetical protein
MVEDSCGGWWDKDARSGGRGGERPLLSVFGSLHRRLPSSEQLRNVFGLSAVTIRFAMSVWQYHVRFVEPGACLPPVYSTSESLMSLSPAHETILVLFVCGMNLAEKMFPECPDQVRKLSLATANSTRVEDLADRILVLRRPDEQPMVVTAGDEILAARAPSGRSDTVTAAEHIRESVDASPVALELVCEVEFVQPCLCAV